MISVMNVTKKYTTKENKNLQKLFRQLLNNDKGNKNKAISK